MDIFVKVVRITRERTRFGEELVRRPPQLHALDRPFDSRAEAKRAVAERGITGAEYEFITMTRT